MRLTRNTFPPHVSELASELGLASASGLSRTLDVMMRLGLISLIGGGQYGKRKVVTVTTAGRSAAGQLNINLVGEIAAGPLTETQESQQDAFNLMDLLPYQDGDFWLAVTGDSMIGDGILPGDVVLLRPDTELQQGEIAAVQVGEERSATLKRVYVDALRTSVTLRASNPNFSDIVIAGTDVRIAGAFRGLIRTPASYKGLQNHGI